MAMQTIRSFIAIPLSASVSRAVSKLIDRLAEDGDGIRWVPKDNLHLTLKFLGDVDNTELPKLCQSLREICQACQPFPLQFEGTGGFPDIDRPRVLFAGVQGDRESLCELVTEIETRFADLGFKPEPRDYRPHLTLGRTRSGSRKPTDDVVQRLKEAGDTSLGEITVDEVLMVGSFMEKRSGPSYQVMDTVPLG
ncbi:MAG: RNA 2',3'-cyclic phosphodiesterase [Planctomycetota bacterium]